MSTSPQGTGDDLDRHAAQDERASSVLVAALHLRRGDHAAALSGCQEILAANPSDLDARELLGDILAAQSKWEAAVAEFQRVLDADRGRASAERKLGEAILGRAGLKDAAFAAEEELQDRKPGTASFLSFLFPGLGQLYNHRLSKGFAAFSGGLTLAIFILWGVLIAPMQAVTAALGGREAPTQEVLARWADAFMQMSVVLKGLLLVACVLWVCLHIWSIFDAAAGARRRVSTPGGH